MSFRSRQKKRKAKAAIAKNKRAYADVIRGRWYLTVAKRTTCCARCGGVLREGRELVYRAEPREALCKLCAESHPEAKSARPSCRWIQSKGHR